MLFLRSGRIACLHGSSNCVQTTWQSWGWVGDGSRVHLPADDASNRISLNMTARDHEQDLLEDASSRTYLKRVQGWPFAQTNSKS